MTDSPATPAIEAVEKPDFDSLMIEFALETQRIEKRNQVAEAMRQQFYDFYIAPYDQEILDNKARLAALEANIRDAALEYATTSGDDTPHPRITLSKRTRLNYPRPDAIKQLQAEARWEYFRHELKVREFEKDAEAGKFPWFTGKREPAPTIQLGSLGDIQILLATVGEDGVRAVWAAEAAAEAKEAKADDQD